MSRESCVTHSAKQAIAIVRQDYYELMGRDACAAALLNLFEYWANAALAANPTDSRPRVGARPIREFEQMLLGIATDKQIRKRLSLLEERGFIRIQMPAKRGAAKVYQVLIPEIQQALLGQRATNQTLDSEIALRPFNQSSVGQTTDESNLLRSNNLCPVGQMTNESSVKQPIRLRSNDPALKNKTKEFKKEDLQEAPLISRNSQQSALEQSGSEQPSIERVGAEPVEGEPARRRSPIQIGAVQYAQPPETIDLADLWANNPGLAKAQLRFAAPGHKRLEVVAHGFGHWWVGPGLNDFDEFLIKACQQRKRKLEQPDSVGDAKTFINNLIRRGDWANFSLRCDEAKGLRDRALADRRTKASIHRATATSSSNSSAHTQRSRIQAEQRQAAIGLAKFKVSRGEIKRAKEIADLLKISYSDIGIVSLAGEPAVA